MGDQIDCSLGVRFGLSTLAAAGLGNLISDVVGISLVRVAPTCPAPSTRLTYTRAPKLLSG